MGPNAGTRPRANIVLAPEEQSRQRGNTLLTGNPRTCTRLNDMFLLDLVQLWYSNIAFRRDPRVYEHCHTMLGFDHTRTVSL